jgi:unconventional prefoldin RPB5 interactor 1
MNSWPCFIFPSLSLCLSLSLIVMSSPGCSIVLPSFQRVEQKGFFSTLTRDAAIEKFLLWNKISSCSSFFFLFGVGMAVMAIAQVLLGEGYYAERSAKQAVEILERRSEFLDSKINATKVHIGDLEAEATFVKNIADEAAAGVVEIKEEYTEPTEFSFQRTSPVEDATPVDGKVSADAEDAKIMARIAELELAEAAAEDDGTGSDDDNDAEVYRPFAPFQRLLLDEDEDEDEEGEDEEEEEDDDDEHEDFLQRLAQLPSSSSKGQAHFTSELYQQQPNRVPSEEHDKGAHEIHAAPHRVRFEDELNVERGASLSAQDRLPPRSHSPSTVHLQAFSGTVLERNPGNLSSNQSVAQEEENRPTRPVSKFKLRKGKDS